jgi:biopolymer transport protein ExbD
MKSIFAVIALTSSLSGAVAQQDKPADLLVVLTVGRTDPVLFVDKNFEETGSYYDVFAKYFRLSQGNKREVLLYVSDELPYNNIDGLVGELQAVGYKTIRTFEFSRKTKRGMEIKTVGQVSEVPFEIARD